MPDLLFTFCTGIIASILSGIAGGGGGLITSPFFLLIGMTPQAAVATAKFGGIGITLGGFSVFRKTNLIHWEYVVPLSILAVIAGIIGPIFLLKLDEIVAQKLIGAVMLCMLPFLFIKKENILLHNTLSSLKKFTGYVSYFTIQILQAAFGSGVGTIIPIITIHLFGFTALESNATRKIPGLVGAVVSLGIFVLSGVVDYSQGFAMLLGTYAGAHIGTRIAIKQGNEFVKWVLFVLVLLLGIKLLI